MKKLGANLTKMTTLLLIRNVTVLILTTTGQDLEPWPHCKVTLPWAVVANSPSNPFTF